MAGKRQIFNVAEAKAQFSSLVRKAVAGDEVIIARDNGYEAGFIKALSYIVTKKIDIIYFGHGHPLTVNCERVLLDSLKNAVAED